MKKLLGFLALAGLATGATMTTTACGGNNTLKIMFIPSKDADAVAEQVKPLETMLADYLKEKGFNYKIEVNVSTSYETGATALATAQVDMAYLPVNSYLSIYNDAKYQKNLDVLVNSSRAGIAAETGALNGHSDMRDASYTAKQAELIAAYNDTALQTREGKNLDASKEAGYYRSVLTAKKGDRTNDLKTAIAALKAATTKTDALIEDVFQTYKWCTGSKTSSAGTVYPMLWAKEYLGLSTDQVKEIFLPKADGNFKYNIDTTKNYTQKGEDLKTANPTCDVTTNYADTRNDWANGTLFNQVDAFANNEVIGVTGKITNDGVQYNKKNINDELATTLRKAFAELVKTEEGKKVFAAYSHSGYADGKNADYNDANTIRNDLGL